MMNSRDDPRPVTCDCLSRLRHRVGLPTRWNLRRDRSRSWCHVGRRWWCTGSRHQLRRKAHPTRLRRQWRRCRHRVQDASIQLWRHVIRDRLVDHGRRWWRDDGASPSGWWLSPFSGACDSQRERRVVVDRGWLHAHALVHCVPGKILLLVQAVFMAGRGRRRDQRDLAARVVLLDLAERVLAHLDGTLSPDAASLDDENQSYAYDEN